MAQAINADISEADITDIQVNLDENNMFDDGGKRFSAAKYYQ